MNHLTVFARPPLPGRVKSRLSPALPAELAARLYAAMLADTLAAAAACEAGRRAVEWSELEGAPADTPGFTHRAQAAGDLGARLAGAFEVALSQPASAAVIVGSDCPALTAALIDQAFAALATHDAVAGPARDGGYWLIGLRRSAPGLFRDIPWGEDSVLALTVERAAELGLNVASLPTLSDVDTPADVAALVGACARDHAQACGPRTRAELQAIGLLP